MSQIDCLPTKPFIISTDPLGQYLYRLYIGTIYLNKDFGTCLWVQCSSMMLLVAG